jgi:hypothetical protein
MRLRRAATARLLAGVALAGAALALVGPQGTAAAARRPATAEVHSALAPGRATQTGAGASVLQLNLCDSGYAACYDGGRSVPEAASVITARRPDTVTLNEVCAADVDALSVAMTAVWPGEQVFWAFQPAGDRDRGGSYLCRDGDEYGIGLLGHAPAAGWAGVHARGGIYPMQYAGSTEQRAWLCARTVSGYAACTTHLSANSGRVALAQCRYLLGTAIPAFRGGSTASVVVGADLNLSGAEAVPCRPAGWADTDDGEVQHVLATGLRPDGAHRIGLDHTDHPAWQVSLR